MQAIKLACASEPPEIQTDRIHVRNGTYFADGHFTPEKEYCMNRLPIAYVPEAPAPTRWLQFLNELLYEEDIPALQEYIGYCLLPVTKAQKMLLMVGKGGEGKSRIGLILRELFGNSMYTGSLQKVETNRFARADLEYKLLLVDDDMKTEALPQTNNIKTLVTLEDKIDIERKGQQSVQGTLYVRFACFGNGSLHALYDKSNGFYRRQLLLTTKENLLAGWMILSSLTRCGVKRGYPALGNGGAASADSKQLPIYHQRTHRRESERSDGAGQQHSGLSQIRGLF